MQLLSKNLVFITIVIFLISILTYLWLTPSNMNSILIKNEQDIEQLNATNHDLTLIVTNHLMGQSQTAIWNELNLFMQLNPDDIYLVKQLDEDVISMNQINFIFKNDVLIEISSK